MRAPTMLQKAVAHCIVVPVGARMARPLSEFVQNFEFACRPKKDIKRRSETKTAQKTSKIKGYNRRLIQFIEKTVFALWTDLYYHESIKSARTSGRFLGRFVPLSALRRVARQGNFIKAT